MKIVNKNGRVNIQGLVIAALLTAIVVVLQLLGSFIKLGPFSISLVLVPIVIGAAMSGVVISSWLGLVFGVVVLIMDSAAFLQISIFGTVLIVLLKGVAAGAAAGIVYKLLEKKNKYLAVAASAVVCPLVNTGIFVLGCFAFFMDTIAEWSVGLGYNGAMEYIFFGMIGLNFLVELGINVVLSPVIVRILNIKKMNK